MWNPEMGSSLYCTNKADRTICAYLGVRRRYRHFVDFRTRLRRCGAKNLRALPPKTWTKNNFDLFLKRQIALDSWLRTIRPYLT